MWRSLTAFLTLALNLGHAQDNFYFNIQPKDTNVINGQSTTLECNVSNTKQIIFYWTLHGDPVMNTTRRYQDQSNLHITRVDREKDRGEFKCIAMNSSTGFSLFSSGASLNVMWIEDDAIVQLQSPASTDEIKAGDELILKCKVDGNPEMHIEWYRNSVRLFRNNRTTIKNKRLHLFDISAHENGIYSCRASNDAGVVDSTHNFPLILPHPLAAQIIHLPKDVTVKKNDKAQFDCVYKDAAITEWYMRDEGPLTNNSRMTIFSNGTLVIHRVRGNDEGFYKCVGVQGVSKDEPIQTYTAELRIAVLGELDGTLFEPSIDANKMTIIPENKDFEMTCIPPSGYPRPHMWWEDPHGKVISDTGRIRVDETRLLITAAKHEDAGNYTCFAENLANKRDQTFQLYISTSPTLVTHPMSKSVEEGESAQLQCDYQGSPYPVTIINWLKDGKVMREDNRYFTIHQHNGTLQIGAVLMNDNGSYVCIVNTTGFPLLYSKPAALLVKEKLKFSPVPPGTKKLELNSTAKINCKSRGATKPTVRWMKEGQRMFEWPSHIRDENGTLYFDRVKAEDKGKYICVATNFQGVINTTVQVDIIVAPKILIQPTDVQAYEGYPAVIHCKAYGDPIPTIQWDKNSVVNGFDQQRFSVMENGSLFVSEVHMDDQGKYGCIAGNSGGFKRVEVSMVVRSAENYTATRNLARGKNDSEEDDVMTQTIIITLGAATAYLVLVIGLIVWCKYRRRKWKSTHMQEIANEVQNKATENGDVVNDAELKDRGHNSVKEFKDNVKSDGDVHSHSSSHSHNSRKSRYSYDHLQFPRQDVHTVMLLGKGEFGDVFLAKAHGIQDGETETIVMVKSLQSREDGSHFHFKREIDMYSKLSHKHIAQLLGMCREVEPHFMIMEYSDWGDLKQFLLATRKENPRKSPRPPRLNAAQIISMCSQIVQGMEYLSNNRYIHRDLAARNCLVTSKLDVKISNSCLSRDTYASEYYSFRNRLIPIRWMSYEAVYEDEYSTKSDVWAFAVLMWEVCTQAELPQADKSDEAYLKYLKSDSVHWPVPDECPKALQPILLKCWAQSPKDRPSFSELVINIGDINIDTKV